MNKRRANSNQENSNTLVNELNPICLVIPTIALHIGINTQDYLHLVESLSDYLKTNLTENLFVISEKNSANLKSLVNAISVQWQDKTGIVKMILLFS